MSSKNVYYVSSHLSEGISQVTGIVKDYVLSFFPSGFFRSIVSNNQDVSVQDDYQTTNVSIGKYTRKLPAFSVKSTLSTDATVAENPIHDVWMDLYRANGQLSDFRTSYNMIYKDHENDHYIGALPKRYQVAFDFSIRAESEPQMWDILGFLKHSIQTEIFFYITEFMQAVIPNRVIQLLALQYNLDLELEADREQFLKQLRKYSTNQIDEIYNPQTGERVYTHNFYQRILVRFSPASGDPNRRNMSTTYADIKFQGVAQLMLYTNYGVNMVGDITEYGEVVERMEGISDQPPSFHFSVRKFLPIEQLEDGKQLIFFKGFVSDAPETLGAITPRYDAPTFSADCENQEQYLSLPENPDFLYPNKIELKTKGDVQSTYNETLAGWQVLLESSDAACIAIAEKVFLGTRGRVYVVEIVAECNKDGKTFEVNTVEQRGTFRFTSANNPQKFNIKLHVKNKNNRIVIRWNNEPTDAYDNSKVTRITFKSIRVLPLIAEVQSTSNTDILYLDSILDVDTVAVLRKDMESGVNLDDFFKFEVSQKNRRYLDENEFKVDWKTMTMTLLNPLFNYTHYLSLYADKEHYNDVLFKQLYKVDDRKISDYKHQK